MGRLIFERRQGRRLLVKIVMTRSEGVSHEETKFDTALRLAPENISIIRHIRNVALKPITLCRICKADTLMFIKTYKTV